MRGLIKGGGYHARSHSTASVELRFHPNTCLAMMPLTTGESNFTSVEPYTKSRLIALPFADILRNYKVISEGLVTVNPLKFLYPNIPKDEAFSRYYNSPQSKGNATVSVLVCVCLHTMFQIGSRLKMTQGI